MNDNIAKAFLLTILFATTGAASSEANAAEVSAREPATSGTPCATSQQLPGSAPVVGERAITRREVGSMRQYAYMRNRQNLFTDAANAYRRIAQAASDDNGIAISAGDQWEANALWAVNLANLGQYSAARGELGRLELEDISREGLRPVQLSLFSAILEAQAGELDAASDHVTLALSRLRAGEFTSSSAAVAVGDGSVVISSREVDQFNNSGVNLSRNGALSETLGQRAMTVSERASVLRAHALYLQGRIALLQVKGETPEKDNEALETALGALNAALSEREGFGESDALWLQALIYNALADYHLAAGDAKSALLESERAVRLYTRFGGESASAPLTASLVRTRAAAFSASGDSERALEQHRCAFGIALAAGSLAQIFPQDVDPYLDLLFALSSEPGGEERIREFFQVAAATTDGAARETVTKAALWRSATATAEPLVREIFDREQDLTRVVARLNSDEFAGMRPDDPRLLRETQQERALSRILSGLYKEAGLGSEATLQALGYENFERQLIINGGRSLSAAATARASNADLDSVRKALDEDEAFLMYFVSENSIYGIAVGKREPPALFKAVSGQQEVAAFIAMVRDYVDGVSLLRNNRTNILLPRAGVRSDRLAIGADLYEALIPVSARQVVDAPGVKKIVINAQGALSELPFGALITQKLEGDERAEITAKINKSKNLDYSAVPWLARNKAISVALSASAFPLMRQERRNQNRPNKAIAFAATPPDDEDHAAERDELIEILIQRYFPGVRDSKSPADIDFRTRCRSSLSERFSLSAFRELRAGAVSAIQAVNPEGNLKASIRDGSEFTDAALQGDLRDYRVVYFGSHGFVPSADDCIPDPMLITSLPDAETARSASGSLFDGMLSASEIFALKLDADLVVLAACETGRVRGQRLASVVVEEARQRSIAQLGVDGRGAVGPLAQSFFTAGARAILATYWTADKDATQAFVGDFFGAAAKPGVRYSEALLGAQASLMNSSDRSHPYYWASFVFVGDAEKTLH